MTIEVPRAVEDELRKLAVQRGKEIGVLLEEALRQYLDAAAITDLEDRDIAKTQMILAEELYGTPDWNVE